MFIVMQTRCFLNDRVMKQRKILTKTLSNVNKQHLLQTMIVYVNMSVNGHIYFWHRLNKNHTSIDI